MTDARLTPPQLDEILALQLTAAWAGEGAGDPPRLGWWRSDLVDPEGGGNLFARLAPRTGAWASLSLVRAVAQRVDAAARAKLARGDSVGTLFHVHRTHEHVPNAVLGPRFVADKPWTKSSFEGLLSKLGAPKVTITPGGRQLDGRAASPTEAASLLAAALLPLAPAYPLPFLELPA
jgi:hypothetical protein